MIKESVTYLYECPKCNAVNPVSFSEGDPVTKIVRCQTCNDWHGAEMATGQGSSVRNAKHVGYGRFTFVDIDGNPIE